MSYASSVFPAAWAAWVFGRSVEDHASFAKNQRFGCA